MSATDTPSVQESYHTQLETIKKERHNTDERSLFEESLRSYTDSTNIDPTRLEAVIRSYNEKFETFKGVFLEQESKE
ncbi:hypothetical protein WICPIJ_004428 [Wickerhamomyces pijperi]|uniref:Uncharacterized protein n=1 Tax=Wickerhamomyces pijperi TaxID=599730 RepID=A0A9P8Q7S2_WICPI|nr:hypothetical protein WICPIJ_004428 [Wickerhamomyces pijperi]